MPSPGSLSLKFLLGLDLGISTAKAALFDFHGGLALVRRVEYLIMPEGDTVETDPETYWRALLEAIRAVLRDWEGRPEQIAAVCVASHTETVIPVWSNGAPSRKAIVWMDNRSAAEARELSEQMGHRRIMEIGGQPDISPIWPVTKMRWLAKNETDHTRRVGKFLLPEDYILYRLCGRMVAEQSVWSSSLLLDIRSKQWCPQLVDFAGIRADQLPEIAFPGELLGTVSRDCSAETGLSERTSVVCGAIDQACSALGAGNIAPGIVTESTGSVLALLATVTEPVSDPSFGIPCHIHAVPNMYCLLPWHPSGGLLLKWFKDTFVTGGCDETVEEGIYERLAAEAEAIPPGCDGLLVLPHFQGALFPEHNESARGVFFGVTLSHRRGHFVRAIMEAVGLMIRRDLEGLERMGVSTGEIRVLGGGARSRLWSQIKADICRKQILLLPQPEAAAPGAAMLGAVGAGIYPDLATAVREMTRIQDSILPEAANAAVYDSAFALYSELYGAVKNLFPKCLPFRSIQVSNAATDGIGAE